MYGVGKQPTDEYGRNCLIARRLVERGVRFIQLYSGGGHLRKPGMLMPVSNRTTGSMHLRWIGPLPRCWKISSVARSWMKHLSSGVASLGGCRLAKGRMHRDAITIPMAFQCGWREAGSKVVSITVRPMNWVSKLSRTKFTCTICTQRFCTSWGSITNC